MSERAFVTPGDLRSAAIRAAVLGAPALAAGAMWGGGRAGLAAWLGVGAAIAAATLVERRAARLDGPRPYRLLAHADARVAWFFALPLGVALAVAQARFARDGLGALDATRSSTRLIEGALGAGLVAIVPALVVAWLIGLRLELEAHAIAGIDLRDRLLARIGRASVSWGLVCGVSLMAVLLFAAAVSGHGPLLAFGLIAPFVGFALVFLALFLPTFLLSELLSLLDSLEAQVWGDGRDAS